MKQKSLFTTHDPAGVKFLSILRLRFSHLNEHKFRHNFIDAISPMCDCGSKTETTDHFFLRCPFFAIKRQELLNDFLKINPSLRNLKDELLLDIILYGSDKYKDMSVRTLLTRKYFFTQLILSKISSGLKDRYLNTNLLLLLLLYYIYCYIILFILFIYLYFFF